jgi:hypothetical protein
MGCDRRRTTGELARAPFLASLPESGKVARPHEDSQEKVEEVDVVRGRLEARVRASSCLWENTKKG